MAFFMRGSTREASAPWVATTWGAWARPTTQTTMASTVIQRLLGFTRGGLYPVQEREGVNWKA